MISHEPPFYTHVDAGTLNLRLDLRDLRDRHRNARIEGGRFAVYDQDEALLASGSLDVQDDAPDAFGRKVSTFVASLTIDSRYTVGEYSLVLRVFYQEGGDQYFRRALVVKE